MRFWISGFSMICLLLASRTFKNLPLRGKTPYLSLPTTSMPASAKLLAESPSVKMIVHCSAFRVPALFASSSLGIPTSFYFFFPTICFAILASSFAFATIRMLSTTPDSNICFRNLSVSSTLLPKAEAFVPKFSLVCESKAGFSIRQLTKIQRFALI